jgi:hypothetical protein
MLDPENDFTIIRAFFHSHRVFYIFEFEQWIQNEENHKVLYLTLPNHAENYMKILKNRNIPFMEYFVYKTRMFRKLYESRFQQIQQNFTMDAFDVSLEILQRNKDRHRSNKTKNTPIFSEK